MHEINANDTLNCEKDSINLVTKREIFFFFNVKIIIVQHQKVQINSKIYCLQYKRKNKPNLILY